MAWSLPNRIYSRKLKGSFLRKDGAMPLERCNPQIWYQRVDRDQIPPRRDNEDNTSSVSSSSERKVNPDISKLENNET